MPAGVLAMALGLMTGDNWDEDGWPDEEPRPCPDELEVYRWDDGSTMVRIISHDKLKARGEEVWTQICQLFDTKTWVWPRKGTARNRNRVQRWGVVQGGREDGLNSTFAVLNPEGVTEVMLQFTSPEPGGPSGTNSPTFRSLFSNGGSRILDDNQKGMVLEFLYNYVYAGDEPGTAYLPYFWPLGLPVRLSNAIAEQLTSSDELSEFQLAAREWKADQHGGIYRRLLEDASALVGQMTSQQRHQGGRFRRASMFQIGSSTQIETMGMMGAVWTSDQRFGHNPVKVWLELLVDGSVLSGAPYPPFTPVWRVGSSPHAADKPTRWLASSEDLLDALTKANVWTSEERHDQIVNDLVLEGDPTIPDLDAYHMLDALSPIFFDSERLCQWLLDTGRR